MLQMKFMNTFCEIGLRWMPQKAFDDESTLVQVMALCLTGDKPLSEPMMAYSTDTY